MTIWWNEPRAKMRATVKASIEDFSLDVNRTVVDIRHIRSNATKRLVRKSRYGKVYIVSQTETF